MTILNLVGSSDYYKKVNYHKLSSEKILFSYVFIYIHNNPQVLLLKMADKELQEELEMLRKTRRDLQEYYYLLRILRNDIEKMRGNFLFTSDICETQKDTKAQDIKKNKKIL